ncbi:MAG TPA: hypothetical protein VG722_08030 [Tepidisphaeraceae bacterium]|nr:hypothetical protein [Tepidisphaeraceae bacterium]
MTMQSPNDPNRDLPPRRSATTSEGWGWGWWILGALVVICIIAWAGWGWNWGGRNGYTARPINGASAPRTAAPLYRGSPAAEPNAGTAGYTTGPANMTNGRVSPSPAAPSETPTQGYSTSTTQP